ncbi:DUF2207 domain-containing protein [Caenispirillum bisanense]|uniref:Predicted membrane protein n=1 Tax=Caenispirillum bisanense TaxID=414052 RepID=A0A286GHK3_9PROT|nr:DUF2207 domain-containing protein [Caenispirillum bisanense]SOD95013.1 Predicted membrane protein [Caenispirillum bisanense]
MWFRTVRAQAARVFVALCLLLVVAALPGAARAAEHILRFAADLAVQPSGDVLVTETIAVRAEGDRIRRGIFRTVPLGGPEGRAMGFALVSADRAGGPVPTELIRDGDTVTVRLGDPDKTLPVGDHVFTLVYRASGVLQAGESADVLAWNVTGNAWDFPIAEASVRVALPGARPPLAWAVATGAPGSRENTAEAAVGADGAFTARSRAGLPPGHGMTVRLDLPKGLVETAALGDADAMADEPAEVAVAPLDGLPVVLGALGVVLIYFGGVWWWVGRDPAAGRVVPRALPPTAMSPAAVRFVRRMGYDTRCLAAALVNMAVNGYLTLDRTPDGGWRLHRTGAPEDVLFPEERALAGKLFFAMAFERGLDDADGRWLRQASDALKEALEKGNADRLFVTNRLYLGGGIVLSALAAVAMLAGTMDIGSAFLMTLILAAAGAFVAYVGVQLVRRARQAVRGRHVWRSLRWLFATLPAGLLAGLIAAALLTEISIAVLVGLTVLLVAPFFFAWALKAPTRDGRRVQDEIEGLAAFLDAAVSPEAAAQAVGDAALPPDRYLPYALALDLERRWAAGFGAAVAAAGVAAGGDGLWLWYGTGGGGQNAGVDADRLCDDLGNDLTAGIDRAATPSGDGDSSSSSGGGISVGGGFGGGGGGGF